MINRTAAAAPERAGWRRAPIPEPSRRAHLTEDVAQRAWQEGLTMSLAEAMPLAQGDTVA
jgi:hypothetical protein